MEMNYYNTFAGKYKVKNCLSHRVYNFETSVNNQNAVIEYGYGIMVILDSNSIYDASGTHYTINLQLKDKKWIVVHYSQAFY